MQQGKPATSHCAYAWVYHLMLVATRLFDSSKGSAMTKRTDLGKERLRDVPSRVRLNAWGPLRGAGIRVTRISKDFREVDIEMKLTRKNRNYVGTHYGGSLFSMTDPFYMVMLIHALGPEYVVWDKAASIRFRRPGRGTMHVRYRLTEERVEEIRKTLQSQEKMDTVFRVLVEDEEKNVVAEVERTVYVARKESHREK